MDRITQSATHTPTRTGENGSDSRDEELRRLVGVDPTSASEAGPDRTEELRSLVGADDARSVATDPAPDLAALVGDPMPGSRWSADQESRPSVGGAGAVDREWLAPELARSGRRPRVSGRGRGGSVSTMSVIVAIAAVVMLAGTTTYAAIQRVTANPADEAMVSLREREAELRNDILGLVTSHDLLTLVLDDARGVSETAASVLPALQGRVADAPVSSAEAARVALDEKIASVPNIVLPDYQRPVLDEKSLSEVGHALDEVRRQREALPPVVDQVRFSRSAVASALDTFRDELRALGTEIESAAARIVDERDLASESFRVDVTDAASRVLSVQQSGSDGLAEMAVFASAVDALVVENERVLDEIQGRTPVRTPPVRSVVPTAPSNPGGSSGEGQPSPDPGSGTGGDVEPTPSPGDTGGASQTPAP